MRQRISYFSIFFFALALAACPDEAPVDETDVSLDATSPDATSPDATSPDTAPDDTSLEVDAGEAACPEGFNLSATDANQLRDIAACVTIPGSLTIEVPLDMQTISLPLLEEVGEELVIRLQDTMTTLELPLLRRAGIALVIDANDALEQLEVPALESVGQRLAIISNAALEQVRFESLKKIGEDLPGDSIIPSINIWNNPSLGNLQMPMLAEVHGGLGLNIHENPSMQILALPALMTISTELAIVSMSGLTSLSFPSLTTLGGLFFVTLNPLLPTCAAYEILSDLTSQTPARVCILGNGADACEDDLSGCS